MDTNLGEEFQFRATADGRVHSWRRGEKEPLEARWDICPRGCLGKRGAPQKLKAEKIEFAGKDGKVERTYKCPQCGYIGRTIRRQKRNLGRGTLKEPER